MTLGRPIHPLVLVTVSVAVLFALHNATFWTIWLEVFDGFNGRGVMFAVAFFLLCCGLVSVFSFNQLIRPFIALLFALSAVTSFYMDQLGVVIDREMIQNAVSTTITEGKHLITAPFVIWVCLTGLLPAVFVFYIRISNRSFVKSIWQNSLTFFLCVIGFVGLIATDLKGNQLKTTQKVYVDRVDCTETAMENITVYKTRAAMTIEGFIQGKKGEKVFRRQTVPLTRNLDEAVITFDYEERDVQPSVAVYEEVITIDDEEITVGLLANRCKDTHDFILREHLWSEG